MLEKPVIFLAFANDRVDDSAYLRNLPKEQNKIREALKPAVKAGLCEVVERSSASIEQILDVFQDDRYKNRIAIFHYGGHANGYQLLLETMEGKHEKAHADGLVSFLANQKGLELVFLNGCSSQQQALDLVEAGISAVIGTSQSISDDIAMLLATRFYAGLSQGETVRNAWNTSVQEAKMRKGTANLRDFYWEGMANDSTVEADRFPWELYVREGAEQVKEWDLPQATKNHLFGLPKIAEKEPLPNNPFLFFEKYSRKYAKVFFGRDQYIRQLYNLVTDKNAPPIVLFFGLSGSGKSSLLSAGLQPRLEEAFKVIYVRRDQELGILKSVEKAFHAELTKSEEVPLPTPSMSGNPFPDRRLENPSEKEEKTDESESQLTDLLASLQKMEKKFPFFSEEIKRLRIQMEEKRGVLSSDQSNRKLKKLWLAIEQKFAKPVVLLLDQVEEAFNYGAGKFHSPTELSDFMSELHEVFGDWEKAPKGKIVLTYRKEFAAELERAFSKLQLPYSKAFLLQLSRTQVMDVVTGLTKHPDLQRKYNLTIESTLPEIIADDLLEDRDSPVAPILQILLTNMWSRTDQTKPEFTVSLYQELKKEGLLMDDFLQQQLNALSKLNPKAVKSGLALDILFFHTNKLGTAAAHTTEEVLQRYHDKSEEVKELLGQLEELYLLNQISPTTRKLSHDTLALLVRQLFAESVLPGQRAARVLQYKMLEYGIDQSILIDSSDLYTIKNGKSGMRTLTIAEEELLDKSEHEIESKRIYQSTKEARITTLEEEIIRRENEEKPMDE